MNILFWNLNRSPVSKKEHYEREPITKYVKECLLENHVDIAIFAEHSGCNGLNRPVLEREAGFRFVVGLEEEYAGKIGGKVTLAVSHTADAELRREGKRYALYSLNCSGKRYILAGVHLSDRRSSPESSARIRIAHDLLDEIRKLEETEHCFNTIIIGDFNANPYDEEMLQIDSFNAALFKDVIRNDEVRYWDGKPYRRLYNPTLHFLSEEPKNYGSYYLNKGERPAVWNCLVQALVSRPLIDDVQDLQYLRIIGHTSLMNRSAPDDSISDHLPLLVGLYGG